MQNESSRNMIVFIVCAALILLAYQFLVVEPANKRRAAELHKEQAAAEAQAKPAPGAPTSAGAGPPSLSRTEAKAADPRAPVATPTLSGSINLRGGRIDDLYLTNFRETTDKDSPPVELFRPAGTADAWFADFGWTAANLEGLPDDDTLWTVKDGSTLAPGQPLVLTYAAPSGLVFTRQIAVDEHYLFTVTDTVANLGAAPVTVAPYASVQRQGIPDTVGHNRIVHEGAIGVLNGDLTQATYKKWKKEDDETHRSKGGWLGITDKYWLSALIPAQDEQITGEFRVTSQSGIDIYDTSFVGAPHLIQPGRQVTQTTRLFAGAKVVPLLRQYEKDLNIPRFDWAVDWGLFSFITRPMFWALEQFFHLVGNFGVAILMLTVAIKLVFFPLANKSYESITKMKKIQPAMEEMKVRFKDDPAGQQKEMMALYQREKINPLMGCLPILIQIPVFYSLYKVLQVTLEMRHAPFFGWIQDLSARDPTTVLNLFGLIPWDPATTPAIGTFLSGPLHIGVWPLIMGFTMWLQQAMNPPAPDPVQQRIFKLFPIVFTFMLSQFAAGLVIYWSWNNTLSILQQYVIMRRFKVDNPIDDAIARFRPKAVG